MLCVYCEKVFCLPSQRPFFLGMSPHFRKAGNYCFSSFYSPVCVDNAPPYLEPMLKIKVFLWCVIFSRPLGVEKFVKSALMFYVIEPLDILLLHKGAGGRVGGRFFRKEGFEVNGGFF